MKTKKPNTDYKADIVFEGIANSKKEWFVWMNDDIVANLYGEMSRQIFINGAVAAKLSVYDEASKVSLPYKRLDQIDPIKLG